MTGLFESLSDLFVSGGFVMPWLALGNLMLWYALGDRAWTLRNIMGRAQRCLGEAHGAGHRREALEPVFRDLTRGAVLITTLTALAPLVGLLGTVAGMIETFDSLTSMSLFRSSGGVAGGISAALITTQMGLAVAIPGLLAGRALQRRADTLQTRLEAMVTA